MLFTLTVDIESRIGTMCDLAHINGNGTVDSLTDGVLILCYLSGLQGETLTNGWLQMMLLEPLHKRLSII